MPTQIDLYSAHGLNPRATCAELSAQLNAQTGSTDGRDHLSRSRLERARTILTDPQRRATYDRMLADPTTTIDERTLDSLAGRISPIRPSRPRLPKSLLIAGAATVAIIVVVAIIVATMIGGADSESSTARDEPTTTSKQPAFVPYLGDADFIGGRRSKKTRKFVTPPQSIKVIGSLDVRREVEQIGYGPIEQNMPKIAKYAQTDSSFPRNPAISIVADSDGDLQVSWSCETMYNKPDGANCLGSFYMTLDISGAQPKVVRAADEGPDPIQESTDSWTTKIAALSVSNLDQLPASIVGTDKATGAPTALVLSAVQPRESSATVYFLVPDALKIFIGELHSTR